MAPPPPRAGTGADAGGLAGSWRRFRSLPLWLQVVCWLFAWPVLAALLLVSPPAGASAGRKAGALAVLLVATPLWIGMVAGAGAEDRDSAGAVDPAVEDDPEPQAEDEPEEDGEPEDEEEPEEDDGPEAQDDPGQDEDESRSETEAEPESGDVAAAAGSWTVTNVVDGDTIDVRDASGTEERVRVVGIDTPERGECGFNRATDAMAALVLGREADLVAGAVDDRDHYDRILRYVDVGGTDAGLELIEAGLAIARYDSRDGYGRHPREDDYVSTDQATTNITCGPEPEADPAPAPAEPASGGPGSGPNGSWKNCTEARDNGAAPVRRGDPGYGDHLDRDQDGVGCE